jgi:hypothetical protein
MSTGKDAKQMRGFVCIGGPLDGQRYEQRHSKETRFVASPGGTPIRAETCTAIEEVKYTNYRLDTIHCRPAGNYIQFWADERLSHEDVMTRLFNKYAEHVAQTPAISRLDQLADMIRKWGSLHIIGTQEAIDVAAELLRYARRAK